MADATNSRKKHANRAAPAAGRRTVAATGRKQDQLCSLHITRPCAVCAANRNVSEGHVRSALINVQTVSARQRRAPCCAQPGANQISCAVCTLHAPDAACSASRNALATGECDKRPYQMCKLSADRRRRSARDLELRGLLVLQYHRPKIMDLRRRISKSPGLSRGLTLWSFCCF